MVVVTDRPPNLTTGERNTPEAPLKHSNYHVMGRTVRLHLEG